MEIDMLRKNILSSYFYLRIYIAILAITFPFILLFGGMLEGINMQNSMSSYYYASIGNKSMRDFFVGILSALGVILFLYKGYSNKENFVLNLASMFAIGVAFIPMEWGCGDQCRSFTLHGACAVALFLCLTFVCFHCATDTLPLLKDQKLQNRYRRFYYILGGSMILSPLAAYLLTVVFKRFYGYAFIAETIAIATFAAYWLVKSKELSLSNTELSAAYRAVVKT